MDAFNVSSLAGALPDMTSGAIDGGLNGDGSNPYSMYQSYGVPGLRPDYHFLKYVLADAGSRARTQPAVSSLSFDHQEELLWMGNYGGHVTSYYGLDMAKYTSFQVHPTDDIRAQLTGPYGLLSLTKNSLRMSIRRGLTVFDFDSEEMKDLYCMARTENPEVILMAGQQSELLEFNLNFGKVVRVTKLDENDGDASSKTTDTSSLASSVTTTTASSASTSHTTPATSPAGCMIIRSHPKFVCCGDAGGKITLRDKNTMKVQHTFSSHSGQLFDFDVRGNHLVTCGASSRNGMFTTDRFLMVYDLRMLKAIAPIGMHFAPFFLRFVPIYASKFCVVSQTGQFQLMDTSGPSTPPPFLHTLDLPPGSTLSAFDVSHSSQALSFGDTLGFIYLFGASTEVLFNINSQPTEFADEPEKIPPIITYDDMYTPFSSVQPYVIPPVTDEPDSLDEWMSSLFSTWPSSMTEKVYRQSQPIDPEVLSSMKMTGSVGYAPNPRRGRYQQIYKNPSSDDNDGGGGNDDENVQVVGGEEESLYTFDAPTDDNQVRDDNDNGDEMTTATTIQGDSVVDGQTQAASSEAIEDGHDVVVVPNTTSASNITISESGEQSSDITKTSSAADKSSE